ncbi:MAG TPA: hypothetical protein OIL96_00145 [Bifidobacteriaceae bacterium]|nr:hypothetical protein [Bifidobacteriaceae bacterium]
MTASTTDVKGLTATPCTFTANWYRAGFHVSGTWDNSPAVTEPAPPPIMLSIATMKSSTARPGPTQPQASADGGEPDEQLQHLIQQIHDGLL